VAGQVSGGGKGIGRRDYLRICLGLFGVGFGGVKKEGSIRIGGNGSILWFRPGNGRLRQYEIESVARPYAQ